MIENKVTLLVATTPEQLERLIFNTKEFQSICGIPILKMELGDSIQQRDKLKEQLTNSTSK